MKIPPKWVKMLLIQFWPSILAKKGILTLKQWQTSPSHKNWTDWRRKKFDHIIFTFFADLGRLEEFGGVKTIFWPKMIRIESKSPVWARFERVVGLVLHQFSVIRDKIMRETHFWPAEVPKIDFSPSNDQFRRQKGPIRYISAFFERFVI